MFTARTLKVPVLVNQEDFPWCFDIPESGDVEFGIRDKIGFLPLVTNTDLPLPGAAFIKVAFFNSAHIKWILMCLQACVPDG